MAAPVIVASTSGDTSAGAALTVTVAAPPTGAVATDLLLAFVYGRVSTGPIIAPAGWTAAGAQVATSTVQGRLYFGLLSEVGPGPYVFTIADGTRHGAVHMIALRSSPAGTPLRIAGYAAQAYPSAGFTYPAPAIVMDAIPAGYQLIASVSLGRAGAVGLAGPAGYTLQVSTNVGASSPGNQSQSSRKTDTAANPPVANWTSSSSTLSVGFHVAIAELVIPRGHPRRFW